MLEQRGAHIIVVGAVERGGGDHPEGDAVGIEQREQLVNWPLSEARPALREVLPCGPDRRRPLPGAEFVPNLCLAQAHFSAFQRTPAHVAVGSFSAKPQSGGHRPTRIKGDFVLVGNGLVPGMGARSPRRKAKLD